MKIEKRGVNFKYVTQRSIPVKDAFGVDIAPVENRTG